MTAEVKPANFEFNIFFDENEVTEEIVNDSLGTTVLADSTGTDSEKKTEAEVELEALGYSTDDRQD